MGGGKDEGNFFSKIRSRDRKNLQNYSVYTNGEMTL